MWNKIVLRSDLTLFEMRQAVRGLAKLQDDDCNIEVEMKSMEIYVWLLLDRDREGVRHGVTSPVVLNIVSAAVPSFMFEITIPPIVHNTCQGLRAISTSAVPPRLQVT